MIEDERWVQSRRMGGAQRYPSMPRAGAEDDGFRFALPILRRYDFAISRRISPEVCIFVWPSRNRGRREDRVLAAPAVPRAICANKTAHEHTGQRETLRPSLRNGFTAYFVLSPENGSFASVACASYRKLSASTAAPEPHDFTVRFRRVRLARPLRPPHLTARS
jgi:hypothetical protein